jgi:hypothetical protein
MLQKEYSRIHTHGIINQGYNNIASQLGELLHNMYNKRGSLYTNNYKA